MDAEKILNIPAGTIIQQILDERNLTTVDLERMTGISSSTLYFYIHRNTPAIPLSNILIICKALNIPPMIFWDNDLLASVLQSPIALPDISIPGAADVPAAQLSEKERALLVSYRNASEDDKKVVQYALRKYLSADSALASDI